MIKKRRLLAAILTAALSISGLSYRESVKAETVLSENVDANLKNEDFSKEEDKKVRVIVQLEKESILDAANQKNIDYSALSESFIEEKKRELISEQNEVVKKIEKSDIEADTSEIRNYDTVLNGIALSVKAKDIDKLDEIQGVKNVYISEEFERPLLSSSDEMTGSGFANDLGYKGEGTVVAVIDSGIDYNHKAFKLDDEKMAKLSETEVNRLIREKGLSGRYYTAKIPYGYNYYDFNTNLYDSYGVMHGMHVSGIVGANDDEKNIYGVAPNTQILALKVFSDDLQYPTTFTDIWLKAMDDAIELGADVVNMSLGSSAGFSIEGEKYPEIEMFEKARKAGVVVAVAAGNDGSITDGNTYGVKPLAGNYDTALIANPALDEGSFAVASMDNLKRYSNSISWMENGKEVIAVADVTPGNNAPSDKITGLWVEVSDGKEDDSYTQSKIKGNLAVMELISDAAKKKYFIAKLKKVAELEPKAIVFYNPESDPEKIGGRISLGEDAGDITVARIKRSTYNALKESVMKSMGFKFNINIEEMPFNHPTAGRLSYFSSWGPTPDLRIKPEITAPGGGIYSTAEDDKYQNMSGTSMASPQVAGASAIIKQYLKSKNIQIGNTADFIKLLLMNTAKPVEYQNGIPYFVRQQGSGALDLKNALDTTVVVRAEGTNDNKADGKLEIKEVAKAKFKAKLTLENFGDTKKTYTIHTKTVYDLTINEYKTEKPVIVGDGQSFEGSEVTVEANSTKEIELDFDYTNDYELEENNYIEGFIELKNKDEVYNTLSIPFLGFYGDWESEKAIDAFSVKELGEEKRGVQFYVNKEADSASSMFMTSATLRLPIVDDTLYFSPSSTYHKDVAVRLAPLRNMEEIEYSILDGDTGEVLRNIGKSLKVRKLNNLRRNRSFNIMPDSWWDGRIDGKIVSENVNYVYQIKAKLNSGNAGGGNTEQIYKYPIRVDNTPPVLSENIEVKNVEGKTRLKLVKFTVKDAGSGIEQIYLNSMKFAELENKNKGNGSTLPPGINLEPPHKKKPLAAEDEIKSESATKPQVNGLSKEDLKLGKPKFGKYLLLHFVDETEKDGKVLPKVIDGKLIITEDMIPTNPTDSARIYVNRNGHRGGEIEVSTYYLADASHIYITVKDYLSNTKNTSVRTGEDKSYVSVGFLNFDNSMKDKKVKTYADGKLMTEPSYNTLNDKIDFKLVMPDDSYHISMLYIREGNSIKYLIRDDVVQPEMKEEFNYSYDRATRNLNFTIKNLKTGREIVTGFKEGVMPEEVESKNIKINLAKAELERFNKIQLDGKDIEVGEDKTLAVKSGKLKLNMIFTEKGKKTAVKGVIVHKKNGENVILEKKAYFDLLGGAEGYDFPKNHYALYIYATIDDDAEIEVIYEGSEGDKLSKPFGNDLFDDGYNGKNNTKTKYPVVFLESPALLAVIPSNNDRTVNIEGFIGNVKKDDKVKTIEVKLVDEKGKPISDTITLSGKDIKSMEKKYAYGGVSPYRGIGYPFSVTLPVSNFCVNIRVEAVTEKGEKASIVRRAFYDLKDPVLTYEVMNRELDSDSVTIKVHSEDDSLRLKLYNGDSLIDIADKTHKTMAEGGVVLDKEIKIPLKLGQNKVSIRAVDLANFKAEKEIYIYRTK
ncbi:MAG: S8 family serine peptidase [Catonella sp.]|uniref:S8 family serine peptidase n=1 Tax=Catonella sp. TaxID=2382125 RepID=UPI003FA01F81